MTNIIYNMEFHSGCGFEHSSIKNGTLFEFKYRNNISVMFDNLEHAKFYYDGFCASMCFYCTIKDTSIACWQIEPKPELISLHTLVNKTKG